MKSQPASTPVSTVSDELLSRKKLAVRWGVHPATVKRRELSGQLRAILIGPRLKRYRLADVIAIEEAASN